MSLEVNYSALARRSPLHGLRILLVEDNADIRELFTLILEAESAQVEVVASIDAGLQVEAAFHPEVVISEIQLPNGDGYRLIGSLRVRELEQGRRIIAIALTSLTGNLDRERARIAGFNGFLTKPVEPGDLVAAIVSLVNLNPS